jgi:hypothetical protein
MVIFKNHINFEGIKRNKWYSALLYNISPAFHRLKKKKKVTANNESHGREYCCDQADGHISTVGPDCMRVTGDE